MKINREEFEKLAALSALEFPEEEVNNCMKELEEIIRLANIVDTHVYGNTESIKNVADIKISSEELREDEVISSLEADKVLMNGKNDGNFFVINRVK